MHHAGSKLALNVAMVKRKKRISADSPPVSYVLAIQTRLRRCEWRARGVADWAVAVGIAYFSLADGCLEAMGGVGSNAAPLAAFVRSYFLICGNVFLLKNAHVSGSTAPTGLKLD